MKFATGRKSRLRHATGVNMHKLNELKRRVRALKHSSGVGTSLRHATGKELDYELIYEKLLEEEEKLKEREETE